MDELRPDAALSDKMGYGSRQEVYTLCEQLSAEIATDETFQGGMTVLRAWGQKGETPESGEDEYVLPPIFPSLRENGEDTRVSIH